jgi:small subunit ribosomal protein S4
VNGRRLNIPSARLREGDVIELSPRAKDFAYVLEAMQSPERDVPDYITVDEEKKKATLARVPKLAEVPYAVHMEPNLVVEFYSR